MGFNTNNNNDNRVFYKLETFEVRYARVLSDKVATADLVLPGLILKGIKMVSTENGEWLSMSQSKGKDGKYYNNYALYLSKDDEKKVMDAIRGALK